MAELATCPGQLATSCLSLAPSASFPICHAEYGDGHPKLASEDCVDDSAETGRRWEVGNKMELKKSNSLSQGWRTSSQICRAAHSHLSPGHRSLVKMDLSFILRTTRKSVCRAFKITDLVIR